MNLFALLRILSALLPVVRGAVEIAEDTFGPRHGSEKLKLAVENVEEALPKIAAVAGHVKAARAAIEPLIEATVAAANAGGALKKKRRRRRRKA